MSIMNFIDWEIILIPGRPTNAPHLQPTVDVFACEIDPKLANTLVRRLNQIAPLENFRHVKRVRKKCLQGGKTQLSLILCLASENDDQPDRMPKDVAELINSYQLSVFITKVCRYAASSKEEWEEQCKLWPTSYHPPTYNIDGITGFSEHDSQSVFNFMKFAIDLAKSGDGQVVNAAVIVDPSVNQVIASACDQIYPRNTPINKTTVETSCNENLEAFVANGGESHKISLSICLSDASKHLYTRVSCLYPRRWAEYELYSGSCWHPLQHAAIVAIEYSAARDRRLFPGSEHLGDASFQMDHMQTMQSSSTSFPVKRQKTDLTNVEDDENVDTEGFPSKTARPYLCTGYDIYLVWEPCPMCAMALVHQRIRRIFYAFPNPNNGALGSVYILQGEKSLNHHYAVFRIQLPKEAPNSYETVVGTTETTENGWRSTTEGHHRQYEHLKP